MAEMLQNEVRESVLTEKDIKRRICAGTIVVKFQIPMNVCRRFPFATRLAVC